MHLGRRDYIETTYGVKSTHVIPRCQGGRPQWFGERCLQISWGTPNPKASIHGHYDNETISMVKASQQGFLDAPVYAVQALSAKRGKLSGVLGRLSRRRRFCPLPLHGNIPQLRRLLLYLTLNQPRDYSRW